MEWPVFVLIVIIVVVAGAFAVPVMLRRVADRGGEQEGDAAEMTDQVIAQMEAFRGDDSGDTAPWDGVDRLKGLEGTDGGGA